MEHEVDIDMRYNGNNCKFNQLAMQLYAKLHKKDHSKAQGLFAAPSKVNAAIASFEDFCRHPLCCGKRKFVKHLYADCWRRSKGINNLQPNLVMPKSFAGNRDGFKPDSRGKNLSGKPFIMSNKSTKRWW